MRIPVGQTASRWQTRTVGRVDGPLPAFLRVEYGMPWGQWVRLDRGTLVVGNAPGLGLSLADPGLAPHHLLIRQENGFLQVETLRASADLRVDGILTAGAVLSEACGLSLGETHLRVLPPPRSAGEAGIALRILRSWMQPDLTTGLPDAGHLLEALAEECPHPDGRCHLELLMLRPRPLDLAAARDLRRALPPDTLLCRAGPDELAAVLPEGAPARLSLPPEWRPMLRSCSSSRHTPEQLLLESRLALTQQPLPGPQWMRA